MIGTTYMSAIALIALQNQGVPPLLVVGETIEGEIMEGALIVHTPTLDAGDTDAPTVGIDFRIRVEESGPHHIDLRSYDFDSYLVLRNANTALLTENDDGLSYTHSRLIAELSRGTDYILTACALHGAVGSFRLKLATGIPEPISPRERARLDLQEARAKLAHSESSLGPAHIETARDLHNLAALLLGSGAYEEAKPMYERAIAIREQQQGPHHPATAASVNNLALLLKLMGAYEESKPLFERALEILEKQQGANHPNTIKGLSNLGNLLHAMGAYEDAKPLLERALAISENQLGPDHPETATNLNNMASLLVSMGAYEQAKPLYERALVIREKQQGPNDPLTATSLNNLASLLESMGSYEEAKLLMDRALAILEMQLGPEHPNTGVGLSSLANLLHSMGAYEEAKPLYERSLAISEKKLGSDHPNTAVALNNLASLLHSLGDYERAKLLYERALVIEEKQLGFNHPQTATGLNNLGLLLHTMGAYQNAKPLLERSLAISERHLGYDHPKTAQSLSNLALLLQSMGAFEESKPLLERSLRIWKKLLGLDNPETAKSLNNLAALLEAMGAYEDAKPLHERALAILEKQLGLGHPLTATSINNLAALLLDLNQGDQAFELIQRHRIEFRKHLTNFLAARTRNEGRRYMATLLGNQELSLSFPRFLQTREVELGAAQALLAWKGQVGRAERAVRQLARESEQTREVPDRLRLLNGELSRLAFDANTSNESRERRLDVLRGQITELDLKLRVALKPDVLNEFGVDSLQEKLPNNAAFVSFFVHRIRHPASDKDDEIVVHGFWSKPHLVACIVRPSTEVISVDLGLADLLQARTKDFLAAQVVQAGRDKLAGSRGIGAEITEDRAEPTSTLRELIWDPLIPHLGDASLVIISHDQFTATFPFEVLKDDNGRYLVENRSFAYLHDLQAIGGFEDEPKREFGSLFCVGGVNFDDREELIDRSLLAAADTRGGGRSEGDAPLERWQSWDTLEGTAAEAAAIRDLHRSLVEGGTQLFLSGTDATEERVLAEMPNASIVHLATHGYFQPEGLPSMWAAAKEEMEQQRELGGTQFQGGLIESDRKLTGYLPEVLSGLVFAGANLEREEGRLDGYLTAADVDWLDLSGVELVTLSACETGLGRSESGEGMSGFRTTLLRAGAKTIVSSLWQVDDDSTEKLMSRFYENLLRHKMGKLEALREAQLWMLRENRRKFGGEGLPYSWGAFVLSGDWR